MIDRGARNKLAGALRALASGLITNDEFEDQRLPYSNEDPAIYEVYSNGAWSLYSDLQLYRLRGRHRLDDKTRSAVARWVLFLKTDLPYEWPISTPGHGMFRLVANLLTVGFANRFFVRKFQAHGDVSVWPFIRRSDYDAALATPVYLSAL